MKPKAEQVTLSIAFKRAVALIAEPEAALAIRYLENWLADKFQSHMTGIPNFDKPLQALFEDIIGKNK